MSNGIFPGTGLPRHAPKKTATCVLVCGESPRAVQATVGKHLRGWTSELIVDGFREFSVWRWSCGDQALSLMTTGLGSSSVELALQEGAMYGFKKFILTGSCATLRNSIRFEELVVPASVVLRPGALAEYFAFGPEVSVTSKLQECLKAFLVSEQIDFHTVKNLSTDAFYGIGASVDSKGRPQYGGAPLKDRRTPTGIALALENPHAADTLDMEAATFFALGQEIEGIEVCGLKAVSNPIPWSVDFNAQAIELAIDRAVRVALDFAIDVVGAERLLGD